MYSDGQHSPEKIGQFDQTLQARSWNQVDSLVDVTMCSVFLAFCGIVRSKGQENQMEVRPFPKMSSGDWQS